MLKVNCGENMILAYILMDVENGKRFLTTNKKEEFMANLHAAIEGPPIADEIRPGPRETLSLLKKLEKLTDSEFSRVCYFVMNYLTVENPMPIPTEEVPYLGFFSRNKNKPVSQQASEAYSAEEEAAILRDIKDYFKKAGLDRNSAKNAATEILESCKKQCEEEGQALYSKIGEKVYEMAKTDEYLAHCIQAAEGDRATREEIIDWWSASDLQRKVVMVMHEKEMLAQFINATERGMTREEAAAFVKKNIPTYGHSLDFTDENRPTSPERKARVVNFINTMKLSEDSRNWMAEAIEERESFNAHFRRWPTH